MIEAARNAGDSTIAERLLAALEAGLEAGGEIFPLSSAALKVAEHADFCSVDLRVDHSDAPLQDLRSLWERYASQKDAFVERVLDPDSGGRATNSAEILACEEGRP